MSLECFICFDQNEYGTYFTGQLLTGKVVMTLNKSKMFKGIKLQICGYAQCQWRERRGKKKPSHKKRRKRKGTFYGHEDYIASTTFLVGSEDGQPFSIEAGTHTYSFSCPIPINCPSSFEGTYGHVRYMVKVTTIRPSKTHRTFTKGFTALKFMDLNSEKELLRTPTYKEASEIFCFFFKSQVVDLRVDLTQTGYVPGQNILVSSHIKNNSKIDVNKLVLTLVLRATYTSDIPCMRSVNEKVVLVKKCCGIVPRHTERDYTETLRVPATPPTCDYLSKVVRISYEICVVAIMKHIMRNPKIVIPITVGNVPLITSAPAPPATSSTDNLSTASSSCLAEETEMDVELPPPTYEEAMFMTANIGPDGSNAIGEEVQFTPRFPVYNVDQMALNAMAVSPPPNPPVKRRRKKKCNSQEEIERKI